VGVRVEESTFRPGGIFVSLRNRNYRLFFLGQTVSFTGTWMQLVAQSWLVLDITGSGTAVGVVFALQFLPMLILAPYAGVIADRTDKRKLLMRVQLLAIGAAGAMGVATTLGRIDVEVIYALALMLGVAQSFDNPVRQSFIVEMVGVERATNAVSLNTVMINTTRIAGPALAGILIARVGAAACFFVNAISYIAAFVAYLSMRPAELQRSAPVEGRKGQLREGLRYIFTVPDVWIPLAMVGIIGTLAFNFQVVIPMLVREVFGRGPESFGGLVALAGVGSMLGGLGVASLRRPRRRYLIVTAVLFGLFLTAFALAPGFQAAGFVAPLVGAGAAAFLALSNSMLQVNAVAEMRGRVLALFSVAFLGSTPVGSPIVGWISEHFGPRAAALAGAASCVVAAVVAVVTYRLASARRRDLVEDREQALDRRVDPREVGDIESGSEDGLQSDSVDGFYS
jgi:MFS family permease